MRFPEPVSTDGTPPRKDREEPTSIAAAPADPRVPAPCTTSDFNCLACGTQPCSAPGASPTPTVVGWRLAVVSLGAFAAPLATAVLGAAWFRGNRAGQWVAGVGGLFLGMAIAAFLARRQASTVKGNE